MFDYKPWTFSPLDMCAVGQYHQDIENTVGDMIYDIKQQYGLCVPAYVVSDEMDKRGIIYETLPTHVKDIIDRELDVY